jgi:hypothetical protein
MLDQFLMNGGLMQNPEQASFDAPLSRDEVEFAASFLEDAASDFADHSSNDLMIPNTIENRKLWLAIMEQIDVDHEVPHEIGKVFDGEIVVFDEWAMRYFVSALQHRLASWDSAPALSGAELHMLAALLLVAHDDHAAVADEVCFDLTLEVTPGTRALLDAAVDTYLRFTRAAGDRAAIKLASDTAVAAKSGLHGASDDATVDIPDFWLMYYLSEKCRHLAGGSAYCRSTP